MAKKIRKINKFCMDCGKMVSRIDAIRCRKCLDKFKIGEKHHNYKIERYRCIKCGKEVQKVSKFCRKCYYEQNRLENHASWKGGISKIKRNCLICNGEFITTELKLKVGQGKYCSRKCYGKSITGENAPNWEGGKSFEIYPSLFNQQLKDRVRVRDNFKCQYCGIPELECGYKLSIHHIDYNKQNNDLTNLISLCRSCHYFSNSNRNFWINYFQHKLQEVLNG